MSSSHGPHWRVLANYDATFISALIATVDEETICAARCGARAGLIPGSARCASSESSRASEAGAFIAISSTFLKLFDWCVDSHAPTWVASLLDRAWRRHQARYSEPLRSLDLAGIARLQAQAEADATTLSEVTAPTARYLSLVLGAFLERAGTERLVEDLSDLFSRLLILADAIDDYESDAAKGRFNAVEASIWGVDGAEKIESARRTLLETCDELLRRFDSLPDSPQRRILVNAVERFRDARIPTLGREGSPSWIWVARTTLVTGLAAVAGTGPSNLRHMPLLGLSAGDGCFETTSTTYDGCDTIETTTDACSDTTSVTTTDACGDSVTTTTDECGNTTTTPSDDMCDSSDAGGDDCLSCYLSIWCCIFGIIFQLFIWVAWTVLKALFFAVLMLGRIAWSYFRLSFAHLGVAFVLLCAVAVPLTLVNSDSLGWTGLPAAALMIAAVAPMPAHLHRALTRRNSSTGRTLAEERIWPIFSSSWRRKTGWVSRPPGEKWFAIILLVALVAGAIATPYVLSAAARNASTGWVAVTTPRLRHSSSQPNAPANVEFSDAECGLSRPSLPGGLVRNERFTVTGYVNESATYMRIKVVFYQDIRGEWVLQQEGYAEYGQSTSSGREWTFSTSLPYAGTWRVLASFAGDDRIPSAHTARDILVAP